MKKINYINCYFQTNKKILYRCLSSIKKDIKIIIVENLKNLKMKILNESSKILKYFALV